MKKNYTDFNCSLRIVALTTIVMLLMIACGGENDTSYISQYYLDPPTGITAKLLSDARTVHITWNAMPNAGHYEISFRTNLDSADTRRNIGTSSVTRYEYSYSWYWYNETDVTTIFYYIKSHPSKSGYIASGWSNPVSVRIR